MSLRNFVREFSNHSPTRMRLRSGRFQTPVQSAGEALPEGQYDAQEEQIEAIVVAEQTNQTQLQQRHSKIPRIVSIYYDFP